MSAPPTFDVLPLGRTSLYESRRAAGIAGARSLRNVPWINVADDGVPVMHAWRVEMEDRYGRVVSVIDARNWTVHRGKRVCRLHGPSSVDRDGSHPWASNCRFQASAVAFSPRLNQ
jgi:hypothetical protein